MHRSSRRCACCDGRYGDGGAEAAAPDDADALQQDRGGGWYRLCASWAGLYDGALYAGPGRDGQGRFCASWAVPCDGALYARQNRDGPDRSCASQAALCDAVYSCACQNPAVWECSYEPPDPDGRDCFDAWPVLPDGRNCFYVPDGPAESARDAVRWHDGPAPLRKLP